MERFWKPQICYNTGGGGGPVTQTSKVELNDEQKKLYNLAFPKAETYANSNLSTYSDATGKSAIADFSPLEVQAQQQTVGGAIPTMSGLAGQAADSQSKMLDANFMLNPNQYVKGAADAVTQNVTKNLMENILPQVQSNSTQAGGLYSGGSTRTGIAQGKAIEGTNEKLSQSLADMYYKNYSTGLAGMGDAISRNPSVMNQQTVAPTALAAVGAQQRSMEQAKMDEEVQNFYTNQSLPFLQASDVMSLVNGMPGATTTSSVTGAQPKANPLTQGLGLGMSALAMK